jgi:hypothetical protein
VGGAVVGGGQSSTSNCCPTHYCGEWLWCCCEEGTPQQHYMRTLYAHLRSPGMGGYRMPTWDGGV